MIDFVVKYDDLKKLTFEMLKRLGYSNRQAEATAGSLVESDARNLHSHGVALLKLYEGHIKAGSLKLNAPEPSVVFETPFSEILDGHSGVGYLIAEIAAKKCVEKAQKNGVAIVAVRYANHYGFAGYWTEKIAAEGLIGVTCTNTVRTVCPTRSAERSLGTNPISVAFPVSGEEPMFLFDMATCVIAQGKINRSREFSESGTIPKDVLIDAFGREMTEFKHALEILATGDDGGHQPKSNSGGLLPLGGGNEKNGGHKGYGLALLVELLTAGLSGGIPSKFIPKTAEGICFFFMAIDPAMFGEVKSVKAHVADIVEEYRKTAPLDPNRPVLIPGDKERASREYSLKNGIILSGEIVDILKGIAEATGLRCEMDRTIKEKHEGHDIRRVDL
jgi:LDH2 family malate/lactate/ureidoglycolate dehydrogenase